jgi:uncharacterized membrane protein
VIFTKERKFYFLLVSVFIVNFLFKLIRISAPSLWYDEIISVQDTLLDFGHIKHEAEWDKNPPFYHYVLWVWSNLFGISELAVRSMSAFFSALTAACIYLFVRKIKDETYAILATLVFTLHPFLYYYAQEARCYSLLLFLIITNLMLVLSLIEDPYAFKCFLLGVLNFLIFYTHYIAGLILFCQFIYLCFVFRKKVVYLLLIYLTPILLVLMRFTKKQYHVIFFSQEMSKQKSNVPLADSGILLDALSQLYVSVFVALFCIMLLFYFLATNMKNKGVLGDKQFQFKLFVIFSSFFCIIILYCLGKWTNVFDARYLIFVTPYIIISLFILGEKRTVLYVAFAFILVFEIIGIKFNQSKRMDYKLSAKLTKEIQKKEKVNILIQTHDVVTLFTYYYDRDLFLLKNRMSKELLAQHNIYYIDNLDDLKNTPLDPKKATLFFQTFVSRQANLDIMQYFQKEKYSSFSTSQIEGVKFTYLKKL